MANEAKRLAITIGGAVSLGSFEAGVLFEVFSALRVHNERCADEGDRIYVDVLTGASAGGMTAAIIAQKLMFDAAALDGEATNSLYRPWVAQADLTDFLRYRDGEGVERSLLSSEAVADIAHEHLLSGFDGGATLNGARHPAAPPDGIVLLGLAMSNLTGVDFEQQVYTFGDANAKFVYTRFQDEFVQRVTPTANDAAFWKPVRAAALACGAFPFAFKVHGIRRDATQFPTPKGAMTDSAEHAYVDGGVFHNEPLGLAKRLVNELDPGHVRHDRRFYLFVSPTLRASAAAGADRFPATASTVAVAARAATAIFNQARFQDWVNTEDVNDNIRKLDKAARHLTDLVATGEFDPTAGDPAIVRALESLCDPRPIADDHARLRQQYADEVARVDTALADPLINLIHLLETVAGLGKRDLMKVYAITATDAELAGAGASAFMGFVDRSLRQYDYDLGRSKARDLLRSLNEESTAPAGATAVPTLGPLMVVPDPLPIPSKKPTVSTLDRRSREQLRDRILNRIVQLADQSKIPFGRWLGQLAIHFEFRKKVDAFLELPAPEPTPPPKKRLGNPH